MLIYRVKNVLNNKVYIGKWNHPTVDQRWRLHKSAVKRGSSYYFHRALRKYGFDAFQIEVIDKADSPTRLSELEIAYIALYQSNDPEKGYNMTSGGEGTSGFKMSEERKKWKSVHSKKFWNDPEYRILQTKSHQEWWTPERREKQAKLQSTKTGEISPRSRKVRCVCTGEVFSSVTSAVSSFGLKKASNLSTAISQGKRFKKKVWEYVEP
jgi:group I intron endonuclease